MKRYWEERNQISIDGITHKYRHKWKELSITVKTATWNYFKEATYNYTKQPVINFILIEAELTNLGLLC